MIERAAVLATVLLFLLPAPASAQERLVQDATGRAVAVPAAVERVFAAGPPASIFVYALAPETLLGWTRQPTPEEAALLPPAYAALPTAGRLTGRGGSANLEAVMALAPDLIVDVGSTTPTYVDLALRVQQQSGIPALLFGGRLEETAETFRALGRALGRPERGAELAGWIEAEVAEIRERIAALPEQGRPRVYYARGPAGLETALSGSINVEVLDLLGVVNVAGDALGRGGLASVSLEQVLAWDPEVIVTVDDRLPETIRDEPLWQRVRAVREGRVFLAPRLPFPWVDFPPGPNRLPGLRWLAGLLYPEAFPEPIEARLRDFYRLFYHREPTRQETAALLRGTVAD